MKAGVEVSPSAVSGALVVAPLGEVDIVTAPELRQRLIEAIHSEPGYSVVLCDLSRTDFMDSSGLGCLVAADRLAKANGRECWVVGASGSAKRIMTITRLIDVLTCYDSLEAAEEALAAGRSLLDTSAVRNLLGGLLALPSARCLHEMAAWGLAGEGRGRRWSLVSRSPFRPLQELSLLLPGGTWTSPWPRSSGASPSEP